MNRCCTVVMSLGWMACLTIGLAGCAGDCFVSRATYLENATADASGGQQPLYYIEPRAELAAVAGPVADPAPVRRNDEVAGAPAAEPRFGQTLQRRGEPVDEDRALLNPNSAQHLRYRSEVARELTNLERELEKIESLAYRKGNAGLAAYESGRRSFEMSRDLIQSNFAGLAEQSPPFTDADRSAAAVALTDVRFMLAQARDAVRATAEAVQEVRPAQGYRLPSSGPM